MFCLHILNIKFDILSSILRRFNSRFCVFGRSLAQKQHLFGLTKFAKYLQKFTCSAMMTVEVKVPFTYIMVMIKTLGSYIPNRLMFMSFMVKFNFRSAISSAKKRMHIFTFKCKNIFITY